MKGRGTKELEQLKSLRIKIQEATSKNVAITKKKGKHYARQIIYINQGHLPTKVTPVVDFADKSIIPCEIIANKF